MKDPDIQIFLCRHGETDWTLSGRHTGWTDLSLNEQGIQQALRLKERLKSIRFNAVFTSPLKRSSETCALCALGPTPKSESDAREWNYGHYEGKTRREIAEANPQWDLFTDGAPGGETPQEVSLRADRTLETLLRHSGNIALFSHGHFLRALAARWLGLPVERGKLFALSVASLSLLGLEHQRQRVIQFWNETNYLSENS